jgi:hypothetical protein
MNGRRHEYLRFCPPAPEHRIDQEAAGEDEASDRAERVEGELPARRRRRVGGRARQSGDDRDQGDDRQVLEEQDREGAFAGGRVDRAVGAQARQHLGGRGQGQGQPDGERGGPAETGCNMDKNGEGQADQSYLEESEAENVVLEAPQPLGVKLESDQE